MGCNVKAIAKTAVVAVATIYGGPIGAAVASAAFTVATGGSFKEALVSAAISGVTAYVAGAGPGSEGAGAGGGTTSSVTTGLESAGSTAVSTPGIYFDPGGAFAGAGAGSTTAAMAAAEAAAKAAAPSLLTQALSNVPGAGQLGNTLASTFPETSASIDSTLSSLALDPIGDMTLAQVGGKAAGLAQLAYLESQTGDLAEQLTTPIPELNEYGDLEGLPPRPDAVIPPSREQMIQLDPDFIDPTDPTTPIEDVVHVAPPPPPEYFARTGPGGAISTGLVDPSNQLSNEVGTYFTNPDIITSIGQLPPEFQEASVDNIIRRLTTNVNDPGFDNFQDVLGTGVRTRANQLSPGTTLDEYNALFNDPQLPGTILRPEAYRRLETALPSGATEGDQFLPDDFDFSSILGPQRDPVAQQIQASAARGNLSQAGLDYALGDINRISTEAESDLRNLARPVASRFDTGFGSDYGSLRDRTRQDITDFDFVGNTTGRQFDFEDIGRQGTELLTSSQPRFEEEIGTLFRAQPNRFNYYDIANRAGTSSGFASGAPVTTGPDDRAVIDALRRRDTTNVRGVGSTGAGVF
jgi:hypothetical protein